MLQIACSTQAMIINSFSVFSVGVPSTVILYSQGLALSCTKDCSVQWLAAPVLSDTAISNVL